MPPPTPSLSRRLFWRERPRGRALVDEVLRNFEDAHDRLPADVDAAAREAMRVYGTTSDWPEYVLDIPGPVVLEPSCGWVLSGVRTRVARSLPYGDRCNTAPGRYLAKRVALGARGRRVDDVVSLRMGYEGNYWHLFDSMLPRLVLLEELGVPVETPIVVAATLWATPYFQHFLERGPLGHRSWIVQDGRTFVHARRAYVAQVAPPARDRFEGVLRLLGVEPVPAGAPERRLFVARWAGRSRPLVNSAELERIAANAGFEVVEPGDLQPADQVEAFRHARYVVGVHGAALANVLFRAGAPLGFLELLPTTRHAPSYFWLADAFGYAYRAIVGDRAGDDHAFVIPPARFEAELSRLLES